jgi:hypothetical protein
MHTSSFARSRPARLLLAGAALAALTPMPAGLASAVQQEERLADRMRRHGDEMERLGDEMERLGEEMGRAAAELAQAVTRHYEYGLEARHAQRDEVERARRHVRELACEMRETARRAGPSRDDLRRLREDARDQARRTGFRERDEIRRAVRDAMREAQREMRRAREEMRRALRQAYRGGVI